MFGMGPRAAGAAVGFALLAAGCASAGASTASGAAAGAGGGASASATSSASAGPVTYGATPSISATMICRAETIEEIGSAVGAKATVSSPTWSNHVYSCTYKYPSGSMRLSVKELPDATQTDAYFHQLGQQMGDTGAVENIGQGAFHTTNGSMVVRKDTKVLLVDVSGLPAQFGQPPTTPGNVAMTVAEVILACWSGD